MTNYLFWKRFAQGKLKTHVSSLKVRIPSPKEILSWSERRLPNSTLVGKVDNAHTVEHDTLRPVSGGLFCERIFGPIATNVCACLRKKGWNEDYCKICEVQFTKSRLRRYQMGHILLAAPVIHVWALQGGYLASLLGKKNFGIRSIAYGKVMSQSKLFESYIYGLTHTEDKGWGPSSQEVIRKEFHGLENDLKKTINIQNLDFTASKTTQETKAQKNLFKNNIYLGASRARGEKHFDATSTAISNHLAYTFSGTFDSSWKQLGPLSFAKVNSKAVLSFAEGDPKAITPFFLSFAEGDPKAIRRRSEGDHPVPLSFFLSPKAIRRRSEGDPKAITPYTKGKGYAPYTEGKVHRGRGVKDLKSSKLRCNMPMPITKGDGRCFKRSLVASKMHSLWLPSFFLSFAEGDPKVIQKPSQNNPKATRYTAKEGYKGNHSKVENNGLPPVIFRSQEVIKKGFPWQYPGTEGFSYFPKSILFPLFLWTKHHSFSTKSTQNLPESKVGKSETIFSKNKMHYYPSLSQRPKSVAFGLPLAKEEVFAYGSPSAKESSSKTHHFTLWKAKVNRKDSRNKNCEVIRTFSRALSEPNMQLILPPISTVLLVHLIYPSTPLPFLAWLSPTVSKVTPLPYSLDYTQGYKYPFISPVSNAFLSFAEGDQRRSPLTPFAVGDHPFASSLLLCTEGAFAVGDHPKGVKSTHGVKGYAPKAHRSIGIGKETKILSYTKAKLLSHEGIGQNSRFLSYRRTNEGVCLWRSHVQKFFGQDKKTKYFKLSSTTKKVISVLSSLYTYKKYLLSERQEKNVKKKKKRVYERGNVLPFHQFILYKADCFKKISQFFDSLNKEQTPVPKLPLPFYSRLESFAKSKSPTLFKSNGDKSKMRLVVKNFKSSRTCLFLPQYPYTYLSFTKATPKEHKSTGYKILSTKLSPTESSASSLPLYPFAYAKGKGEGVIAYGSPSAKERGDLSFAFLWKSKIRKQGLPTVISSRHKGLTKGLKSKISSKNLFGIRYTNGKQNNAKNTLLPKMDSQYLNPYSLTFISPRGIKDSRREIKNSQKSYTIDSTYFSPSGQVLNTTPDLKAKRNFGVFNKFDVLYWRHTKIDDSLPALLYPFTPFYPYSLTFLYPSYLQFPMPKAKEFEDKTHRKCIGVIAVPLCTEGVYPFASSMHGVRGISKEVKEDNLLPTSTLKSLPFQKSPILSFTCSLPPVGKSQVNTNIQKKLKNIEFTGPSVLSQTLKNLNLVLLDRLVNWKWKIGKIQLDSFLLQNKLTKKKRGLRNKLAKTKIILTRRKKLIQSFLNTKQLPEWMILSVLPVLPPALRPILELEPNNVVVSDLNTLYQTVIRRNDALMGLLTFRALEIDILNRQVSLQQAIEKLFDKGAGTKKRPVKSLSQGFHGKRGLFRLHLLGKRVDYSGRSVIVVGPRLKLHECGLPKEMALVLFLPFLIARLKRRKVANNTSQAKQLIIRKDKQIWSHLKALIYEHPVLLNRAPTLHRLGFQAFQPILVSGKAIILPALVCTGFNADFDGDQMAVHVPLSYAARAESWKLLYAKNNMLSPATGKPIIVLSQEMILGCYCSTLILNKTHFASRLVESKIHSKSRVSTLSSNRRLTTLPMPIPLCTESAFAIGDHPFASSLLRRSTHGVWGDRLWRKIERKAKAIKNVRYFTTFQEVHMALNHNKIALQTAIWLRIPSFEDNQLLEEPLEIRLDAVGHSFRSYGQSQRHFSKNTKSQNQIKGISYIRTSAGRIQLNEIFYSSLRTSDSSLSWAV